MNPNESTDRDGDLNRAGDALQALADGPARQAADSIAQSFSRAGKRIASELQKAARSGEFSFRRMAESILNDLARIAINKVVGGVLGKALGGLFGARADGGPVLPGGAYLVGERGPEVFRPASAGTIETTPGQSPVVVNFNLGEGADVNSFRRSQGQIAAILARAVDSGRRRL